MLELLQRARGAGGYDCVVASSGGKDSMSIVLRLIVTTPHAMKQMDSVRTIWRNSDLSAIVAAEIRAAQLFDQAKRTLAIE